MSNAPGLSRGDRNRNRRSARWRQSRLPPVGGPAARFRHHPRRNGAPLTGNRTMETIGRQSARRGPTRQPSKLFAASLPVRSGSIVGRALLLRSIWSSRRRFGSWYRGPTEWSSATRAVIARARSSREISRRPAGRPSRSSRPGGPRWSSTSQTRQVTARSSPCTHPELLSGRREPGPPACRITVRASGAPHAPENPHAGDQARW